MKRPICRLRESTGVLIAMCDPCFDAFEARTFAAAARGEAYTPSDDEVACIDPVLVATPTPAVSEAESVPDEGLN